MNSDIVKRYTYLDSLYHFIIGMTFSITIGYGNPVLSYIGLDSFQIGIVFSLAMILSMLIQAGFSVLVENKRVITLFQSFQIIIMISIFCGIGFVLFSSNRFISAMIFLVALAASTAGFPALGALTIDCTNAGYNINFGLARSMGSIGYATVGFLGGFIFQKFGMISSMFFYIILNIMLLIFTRLFPNYESKVVKKDVGDDIHTMLKENKNFTLLLLGTIFLFFSHNLMNNFLKNIVSNVGGNDISYGVAIGMASFLELPTMIFFSIIMKRNKILNLLKISGIFMSIKIIIIAFSWNFYGIVLAQLVQPLAFALFTPVVIYYVKSVVKQKNQVKGQFLIGVTSMGIGGALGNVIGGFLIRNIGVNNSMYIATIITIIGSCIFLILKEGVTFDMEE